MCSLNPVPLMRADQWLDIYRRFWTGRLDTLERLLGGAPTPPPEQPVAPTNKENHDDDDA